MSREEALAQVTIERLRSIRPINPVADLLLITDMCQQVVDELAITELFAPDFLAHHEQALADLIAKFRWEVAAIIRKEVFRQLSQQGLPVVYSVGPLQAPEVLDEAWKEYLQVIADKKFEDPRQQPSDNWMHRRFNV